MKWEAVTAMLLLPIAFSRAGFEQTEGGARARAMGNAFVGLADDVWAIQYNPAGLARVSSLEFSGFYSPQPFGLAELRLMALAAAYPTSVGTFGVAARRFGFELYRETSFSIGYAREIGGVFAGLNVNYHSVAIERYGSAETFALDAGVLVPVVESLRFGIAARNVSAAAIGESRERLPQTFTAGLAYSPIENADMAFDYQKEPGFVASPRGGIEYWIIREVVLRLGFSDQPSSYTAGLGLRYMFVQFDYGFATH
jgi:hypothetical protein